MDYRGDYYSGCDVTGSFTTVTTTGAPTAISATANSLCLVAYRLQHGDATGFTCSTAGITLATNCSGRTGWNTWGVRTNTDPTFYACGHDYELVLQGGTVGGTCVSGYVVGGFSLVNRAALLPQTFGRKLTVTTGGAANINWAGVESCTNATTLSCTTIYTADHLVQRPVVDSCSTIFSVQSLLNDVHKISDVSNIGAGSAPSANSIACTVWDELQANAHNTCGSFGYLLNCRVSDALQPERPGRRLAVTTDGSAAIDWGHIANCTTAQTLSCTTFFSVTSLLNDVHKISDVSNISAGSAPSANSIACTVWDELQANAHNTCGSFGYLLNCRVSDALQPEIPNRRVAVTSGGNVGVNWGRVESCTTVQNLTCTSIYVADHLVQRPIVDACSTIYTADHLVQRPIVDACSTIFSVHSLDNVVIGVTAAVTVGTNNDKTGYSLSAAGIACVTSAPLTEPANVPGWPMSLCTALAWLAALGTNCITQTAVTQSLCNRATNTTIASAPITCTSTIVHRGTWGSVIP